VVAPALVIRSLARSLSAIVACAALLGCSHEGTYADRRGSLVADERAALDAALERAGIAAGSLLVRDDLYDVPWRGATSHARLHGAADRAADIDRKMPDRRNAVAIEGGHVVALRLAGGHLDDLRVLAPLVHLVVLDVHDQAIGRIDGLDGMAVLDHLDVSGNRITSFTGLEHLRSLRSLYAADDRLTGLTGLDGLQSLEVLNVSGNAITSLEGVRRVPTLQALSAERNPIDHIDALDGDGELLDLDLAFCNVQRLENLGTMPKLKYLNLWHDRVHSLFGVEDAPNLLYLGLGENGYPMDAPEDAAIRQRFCSTRLCTFI